MSKKLLLFDGHSVANRAFYGVPLLTNKQGQPTNAIFGFFNILLSLIDKEKPDYVGVTFDLNIPTFRHKLSDTYKANRKKMQPELRIQIERIKELLEAMQIQMISKEGYEADDLLGTLAKRAEKDGMQVTIVSGDRDLFQVASNNIEIKIPRTKKNGTKIESFFEKDVIETYGVLPKEFIDVKALMGDPSDNIKGVPGIGEKTAIKLIQEYRSIENLLDKVEIIKQKKVRENLTLYANEARESKVLVTIQCDVPIDCIWEDFEYHLELDENAIVLFEELELKTLLDRLPHKKHPKAQLTFTITELTNETFIELIESLKTQEVAFHYFLENEICGLAIAKAESIYYKEWDMADVKDKEMLRLFFQNQTISKISYDSKQLMHDLFPYEITLVQNVFDIFIGAYLLNPTTKDYNIAELERLYLGSFYLQTNDALLGKGKDKKNWLDINQRKEELCKRAYLTLKIRDKMKEQLIEKQMVTLFEEIEMPLINVLFSMEVEGIKLDSQALQVYSKELDQFIHQISDSIYEEVGESFNINSPKQLGTILFEKLKLPVLKKTKTGYSTAAEVLETLSKDYPIVEKILEYRQYTKLKSTYVDGLLAVMTSKHKVHSTFNQTITATGRLSSSDPNLQNIPIKFEMGKKIRKLFIPSSPDYLFLDGDYSQIELRLLAHISGDETLINAFNHNIDIHTLTASQVFHVPFEEVTSLQRSRAKAVNFGIVYGIGAFALAGDIKVSQKEAQSYIDHYFAKYPRIQSYIEDTVAFAMKHGYVETLYHRRREIPEILSSNYNIREFGKRVAMNAPIQGTAADIIKIAMIRIYRKLKEQQLRSKLILTVHDELLIETHREEIEIVKDLLKNEMEHVIELSVPLLVEVHQGENWLEAK